MLSHDLLYYHKFIFISPELHCVDFFVSGSSVDLLRNNRIRRQFWDNPPRTREREMSLWVDKHRPNSLSKLDYHKEQAQHLKQLVCGELIVEQLFSY